MPCLSAHSSAEPASAIRRAVAFPGRTDLSFEELDQLRQSNQDCVNVIARRQTKVILHIVGELLLQDTRCQEHIAVVLIVVHSMGKPNETSPACKGFR